MQLSNHVLDTIKDSLYSLSKSSQLETVQVELGAPFEVLPFLAQCHVTPIIYFAKPKQSSQYVAFGEWAILSSKEAHHCTQTYGDGIHLFGACSFDQLTTHQQQRKKEPSFQSEYWVLPKCWLEMSEISLILNVVFDLRYQTKDYCWDQLSACFDQLNNQKTKLKKKKQQYYSMQHVPEKSRWDASVKRVKKEIQNQTVEKVVLARQTSYQFIDAVNPFILLHDIQQADNGVYHFCVKVDANQSFIGGTPERLFEISQQSIHSEAVAGTMFKPDNINVEDLKSQLLQSTKDRREHQLVVNDIEKKLETLCLSCVSENVPSLIELRTLIHLIIRFEGQLADNMDWYDCLTMLHPTPAVAGTSIKKSIAIINQEESFSREWYAGPIGIVSKTSAQIVVAIRSGVVVGNNVTLFAGAGIVAESDPDEEWAELNAKINLFTELFKSEGSKW